MGREAGGGAQGITYSEHMHNLDAPMQGGGQVLTLHGVFNLGRQHHMVCRSVGRDPHALVFGAFLWS